MKKILFVISIAFIFSSCVAHDRYAERQRYIRGELDRVQARIVLIDSLWLSGKLSHDELVALLQSQVTSIEGVLIIDQGLRELEKE